jgi:hypothetical protein
MGISALTEFIGYVALSAIRFNGCFCFDRIQLLCELSSPGQPCNALAKVRPVL